MRVKQNHNRTDYEYEIEDLLLDAELRDRRDGSVQNRSARRDEESDEHGSPRGERNRRFDAQKGNGAGAHHGLSNKVHWILRVAIVLILATAVIGIVRWNKGEKSIFNPDAQPTSDYDIEVQDQIIPVNPANFEGHADDGKETILFLGNDTLTDDLGDTGIPKLIGAAAGADVIQAGIPGTRIAGIGEFTAENADVALSFYFLATSIKSGDWTNLEKVAALHTDDSRYSDAVQTLAALDFNTVDTLVIFYDAQDYLQGVPLWAPEDDESPYTYAGALKAGIKMIQETYPFIRIIFLSPCFVSTDAGDVSKGSGDDTNIGNGTMTDYWNKAIETTIACECSFIDNYYGSVTPGNYKEYMTDNIHLNEAGRKAVADHYIAKIVNGDTGEYGSYVGETTAE